MVAAVAPESASTLRYSEHSLNPALANDTFPFVFLINSHDHIHPWPNL